MAGGWNTGLFVVIGFFLAYCGVFGWLVLAGVCAAAWGWPAAPCPQATPCPPAVVRVVEVRAAEGAAEGAARADAR
jgi:hypothetical protein